MTLGMNLEARKPGNTLAQAANKDAADSSYPASLTDFLLALWLPDSLSKVP
jgi:hypothetical protein